MATLPSDVPTGLVTGQFYFVSEDAVDANTDPEMSVVTGVVKFTASVPVLQMPRLASTLVPLDFRAKFNAQGQLIPLNGNGLGIELPATNSVDIDPMGYTWKVEFDLRESATNYSVNIPSFNLQISQGEIIDLTTAMPVSESQGVITLRGPAGPEGPMGPPGIADDEGVAAVIADPESLTNAELAQRYASADSIDGGTP